MRQRDALGVVVLIAVAAATAYADASDNQPDAGGGLAAGPVEPPVVDCKSRAQIIPPRHPGSQEFDRRRDVIAGPLVFLSAKRWGNVRRRALRPDPGELTPVKIPFVLEARKRVTVTISPPEGRTAELGVATEQGEVWGLSVELRSCPRKARVAGRRVGPWTPYPAGYRIDGPMCLGVTVEVAGRAEPIKRRLAFGTHSCEPIIVTRNEGTARPNCSPREVGTRLQRLSWALHTINTRVLRREWDWGGFEILGVARGRQVVFRASTYKQGIRKLRRRGGLRLRFTEVDVLQPGTSGTFQGVLTTKSGSKPFHGQWGWRCRKPGLIRMPVLVTRRPIDLARCPAPSEQPPTRAMIVCTRESASPG